MAPRTHGVGASEHSVLAAALSGCRVLLVMLAILTLVHNLSPSPAFADESTEKSTVPVPTKNVLDSSTPAPTWSTQTTAGVGDTASYRLQATLPEDLDAYTSYSLWFNDHLSEGLAYVPDSVHAYIVHQDVRTEKSGLATTIDKQSLRVGADNIKALAPTLTPTDVVVVEYDCTVLPSATCGLANPNTNTLTLQYSSSPNDNTLAEQPIHPHADVYSFRIDLHKIAQDDQSSLQGAHFVIKNTQGLYRTEAGTWAKDQADAQVAITDKNGMASFPALGEGAYELVETQAPTGYALLAKPVPVTISVTDMNTNEPTLTASVAGDNVEVISVNAATGVATVQVEDPKSDSPSPNPNPSPTPTSTAKTTTTATKSSTPSTADSQPAPHTAALLAAVAAALIATGTATTRAPRLRARKERAR